MSHTIFRLGTWYGLYRLIIAVSLNIILVLTDAQIDNSLLLANHFIQKVCMEWGISSKQLTASAETYLLQQDFPGNVRELRNMIERAITLSDDESIDLTHLAPPLRGSSVSPQIVTKQLNQTPAVQTHPKFPMEGLERYLENIEKDILLNALNMTHWNRTLAAKKLGMTFRSLRYRLKKFGLDTEMGEEV